MNGMGTVGKERKRARTVILSLPRPPAAACPAARPPTCRPARRASGGTALPPRAHTSPAPQPSPPTPPGQGHGSRSRPPLPTAPPNACSRHPRTATTAAADAPIPRSLPRGRPIRGRATRSTTRRHLAPAYPTSPAPPCPPSRLPLLRDHPVTSNGHLPPPPWTGNARDGRQGAGGGRRERAGRRCGASRRRTVVHDGLTRAGAGGGGREGKRSTGRPPPVTAGGQTTTRAAVVDAADARPAPSSCTPARARAATAQRLPLGGLGGDEHRCGRAPQMRQGARCPSGRRQGRRWGLAKASPPRDGDGGGGGGCRRHPAGGPVGAATPQTAGTHVPVLLAGECRAAGKKRTAEEQRSAQPRSGSVPAVPLEVLRAAVLAGSCGPAYRRLLPHRGGTQGETGSAIYGRSWAVGRRRFCVANLERCCGSRCDDVATKGGQGVFPEIGNNAVETFFFGPYLDRSSRACAEHVSFAAPRGVE